MTPETERLIKRWDNTPAREWKDRLPIWAYERLMKKTWTDESKAIMRGIE